jgi:hypothetical protein
MMRGRYAQFLRNANFFSGYAQSLRILSRAMKCNSQTKQLVLPTNLCLDPEAKKALIALAQSEGRSLSDTVSKLILAQSKRKKPIAHSLS